MLIVFLIVLILASAVLGIIVLIQNPKGGGLAGNIAGFSNQFMGVKQTTDVLEKGTWLFAAIIAVLCITSSFFISGKSGSNAIEKVTGKSPGTNTQQPGNTASPFPNQPVGTTPDSGK